MVFFALNIAIQPLNYFMWLFDHPFIHSPPAQLYGCRRKVHEMVGWYCRGCFLVLMALLAFERCDGQTSSCTASDTAGYDCANQTTACE